MDQYRTQPFEPEAEPPYEDWEYQDPRPKILWGRVAVLGGVMLVAFFLGRALAPDGIPQSDLTAARDQVADLQADVEQLSTELRRTERELTRLESSPPPATTQPSPEPSESPTLYTVQRGDTLLDLAEEFYGDPAFAYLIADENDMKRNAKLNLGDTLVIPPKPD
jgi:nucleoid-associated protein YgaU